MRVSTLALLLVAAASPAAAQTRISAGIGYGIAGSTESSLSDGKTGTVYMGQIVRAVLPFAGLGVEVNRWHSDSLTATFATGFVQFHLPLTGLLLKAGGGYGTGDPDGRGGVNGPALHFGAAYDLTVPAAPIALTVFGNALLSHATSRSLQMVDGGVALTIR
jgi:hypothetical protein